MEFKLGLCYPKDVFICIQAVNAHFTKIYWKEGGKKKRRKGGKKQGRSGGIMDKRDED